MSKQMRLGGAFIWAKLIKKLRGSARLGCNVHKTSKIESGTHMVNTTVGRHSFCGYDCEFANADVGSFCSIANGVCIGGGRHPLEWVGTSPVFYAGRDSVKAKFSEHEREPVLRTVIGNDVWIGRNALIAQGVKIGNGAVVGMGSVVTKDVDDYAIVGGVPAKKIRMRFEESVITQLLEIKWWDFSDQELRDCAVDFKDPHAFIAKVSS